MKQIISIIMALVTFVCSIFTNVFLTIGKVDDIRFVIDAGETGEKLGNKVSNVNVWSTEGIPAVIPQNTEADISGFTQYIQIMQATGGNAQRDLFDDPTDMTVLDDYNFDKLISACRAIVAFGAKPHIKTGNVPMKYSQSAAIGAFGVNVCPPDDYDVYYNYIAAMAQALVDTFGREQVLTWRFGVFTEYENSDWFEVSDGDPNKTFTEFCKIYDYTVAALLQVIGDEVFVGAHSMSVSQGLWDECRFIEHVANGTNFVTGKKGTRICFLSASFYDSQPGKYNETQTLIQTINTLRDKALSVGLDSLIYGVDEGRILSGTKGSVAADLNLRICGHTYQAAYDARLIKQMADNDIDYFSSWGYSSGGLFSGYPTVAYHVAKRYSEMVDMTRVNVERYGIYFPLFDKNGMQLNDFNAIAAVYPGKVSVMAYNFKNDLSYEGSRDVSFTVKNTDFANGKVKLTAWVIDDNANFFDEWQSDRKTYGITDDCFTWSPDDPALDTSATLTAQWARDLYFDKLRDTYRQCAQLDAQAFELTAHNGNVTIDTQIAANTVVFFDLTTAD